MYPLTFEMYPWLETTAPYRSSLAVKHTAAKRTLSQQENSVNSLDTLN